MKRGLIAIGILGLVLAACGGDDTTETFSEIAVGLDGGGDLAYETPTSDTDLGDEEDLTASYQRLNLDIAASDNRKVIRNASLQLAADNTRDTYDEIVRIAESVGGFVESAEVSPTSNDEQPAIFIAVRVPSAELSDALLAFKKAATEVVSESQGAQDVTETFIDLEAQLTNLTALEVELRALLEEVRKQPDADPDKLLRVFTEISNTRGEIERIQGQLNYLGDAVDLASAQISIEPTAKAVPIVEAEWAPGETVRAATRTLVAGLQNLTDTIITFVIAVVPMLILVVVIPGLIMFAIYRIWKARRKVSTQIPQPVPTE